MKLNAKQQLFVSAYLADKNATQAAIKAGYSKKTAYSQGARLLSNVGISRAIQIGMNKQIKKFEVTTDMVVQGLAAAAELDVLDLYNEDGTLKPISEIPEHIRKNIVGIDTVEEYEGYGRNKKWVGTAKKVRFEDRTKSRELLGKFQKMFVDVKEISGRDGKPIAVVSVNPEDVKKYMKDFDDEV